MRTLKAKALALYCTLVHLGKALYISAGIVSLTLTAVICFMFRGLIWPVVLLSMIPCSVILVLQLLTYGNTKQYLACFWKLYLAAAYRRFDVFEPIEQLARDAHTGFSSARPASFDGEAEIATSHIILNCIDRGMLRKALVLAEKQMQALSADSGADVAAARMNLVASIELEVGNYRRACKLAEKAMVMLSKEENGDPSCLRTSKLIYGLVHAYEHRFDEAGTFLAELEAELWNEREEDFLGDPAIGILRDFPIQSDRALLWLYIGKLARLSRDYRKAISYLQRGLKYTRKNGLDRWNKLLEPEYLLEFASVRYALGAYKNAEELFKQSIESYTRHLDYRGTGLARAYVGLARAYVAQGRPDGAEKLLNNAQSIQQFELNPDHAEIGERILARAELRKLKGLNIEATMLFRRAVHMMQNLYGGSDLDVADGQFALSQVCSYSGGESEAQTNLEHALTTYKNAYGNGHARTGAVKHLLEKLEKTASSASGETARAGHD